MPFIASMDLQDMVDPAAVTRCARGIADRGGDRLRAHTRRNTPIDTSPFRDKPQRPRGTARDSIERSPVEPYVGGGGRGYRVRVLTSDPVFPFIEWNTKPHVIRPRKPGGSLRWRDAGGVRFAKEVRHPGTTGQHPFALGALKTEAEVHELAAGPLARFRRDFVRSGHLAA